MSGLTPAWSAAHSARALHDRLDDDRGEFVGVPGQLRLERGTVGRVVACRHLGCEHLPGQDIGPQLVHAAIGVTDAHRGEGVAVITTSPGHQPVAARTAQAALVLQGHLDGHLDRHRTGIGEEDGVQTVRGDLDEQLRQPGGRLVGQTAEHHMVHRRQLSPQRGVQHRMPVAVYRGPPGRHGVEHLDLPAVPCQRQPRTPGRERDHRRQGARRADRAVGVPDMSGVDGADRLGRQAGLLRHGHRA